MSKLNFNFEKYAYINRLKSIPSADGCSFIIDKREALAAYKAAKSSDLICKLPAEVAFKEAAMNNTIKDIDENSFEIGVAVFSTKDFELIAKYPAMGGLYSGSEMSVTIKNYDYSKWAYAFYCDDVFYTDERADRYITNAEYGLFDSVDYRLAVFDFLSNEDDVNPHIKYEDAFVYQLHVRGFTKHSSSGTRYKGTFKGITDKIDYLKELGVTTLELQPINEFNECDNKTGRLNYWGYCKGYYYSVKSAYSYSKDSSVEFMDMVKALHSNGLEVIIQMFFPKDFSRSEIVSILEYWTVKYHIDGFHILGENINLGLIENSSILTSSKIWVDSVEGVYINNAIGSQTDKRYALYRDDYMFRMRRFLKADEFSILDALACIRQNNSGYATVNYFDSFNSFTLMDMVSYERKHNEDNGEENRDGNDYNCSWNCGEEGGSRKTKVLNLRKKQIRNALLMLLLSSGTPMIVMGDEFGRTQNGNNNPYCQDSKVTWVDWSLAKKNFSNIDYIKSAIKIRKEYPILHGSRELSMVDVAGCGYPEISYHGESAWKTQTEGHKHDIGIMFCDKGKLLYMAINMHWQPVVLSMPRPPKGMVWKAILKTDETLTDADTTNDDLSVTVAEHSISLYTVMPKLGEK